MIRIKEFTLGTGDRTKELEEKINEFMEQNDIWDTQIINIAWQKPMIANLIYKE